MKPAVALVCLMAALTWDPRPAPAASAPPDAAIEVISASELAARIAAEDLETWLGRASAFHVIDIRTPEEFARGHIPGAENIPLAALAFARAIVPDGNSGATGLDLLLASRGIGRGVPLVIYDAVDGPSSAWISADLRAGGYGAACWLTGGFRAWQESGGAVTGPDRQSEANGFNSDNNASTS